MAKKDTLTKSFTLPQFQKYFESDESVNPPVKLEPCLSAAGDQIYLTEPLVRNVSLLFIERDFDL